MTRMKSKSPVCVKVSALEGGHLTLPEKLFIKNPDPEKKSTVPSLSFLIQHPEVNDVREANGNKKVTRMIFDLGIKRNLSEYPPAQQSHIANRQPVVLSPDVAESLRIGGLDPASDIDIVLLSHVHWDHIGTPSDFSNATFVVGSGTMDLLQRGAPPHYPAETFDSNLLPADRTLELPPASTINGTLTYKASKKQTKQKWTSFAGLPHVLDLFNDGSVWVVDSPGHLPGHVNLLLRLEANPDRWVYLGGDCCHDVRILRGEKNIALYDDGHGGMRSVHVDTDAAEGTLGMIRKLLKRKHVGDDSFSQGGSIEAIVAHDKEWRETHSECFFPGTL